jgi:hypothetical protein
MDITEILTAIIKYAKYVRHFLHLLPDFDLRIAELLLRVRLYLVPSLTIVIKRNHVLPMFLDLRHYVVTRSCHNLTVYLSR